MNPRTDYRDSFLAVAEQYLRGHCDASANDVLLRWQECNSAIRAEDANKLKLAIENLPDSQVGDVECRLYLLVSGSFGPAEAGTTRRCLDSLARHVPSPSTLEGIPLASACLAFITASDPNDEVPLREELAEMSLRCFLTSPLDSDQKDQIFIQYFSSLPDWAIPVSASTLLAYLGEDPDTSLSGCVIFAGLLGPRLSPDAALLFHCGGYLAALGEWTGAEIIGMSRLQLLDASICRIVEAAIDGAGDSATLSAAARTACYYLRELPLRSRIEVCRELLAVLLRRGAWAETTATIWYQLAEWLSGISIHEADRAVASLSLFLEANPGVDARLLGRIDILRSRLALRNGDLTAAREFALSAAGSSPDDHTIQAKTAVILAAMGVEDSSSGLGSISYPDRLGLSLLKAERLLDEGSATPALAVVDEALSLSQPKGSSKPTITMRRLRLLRAAICLKAEGPRSALPDLLGATESLLEEISSLPTGLAEEARRDWFAESEAILDRAFQLVVEIYARGEDLPNPDLTRLWRYASCLRDVELTFHEVLREAWRGEDRVARAYKEAHDVMETMEFSSVHSLSGSRETFSAAYAATAHACRDTEVAASLSSRFMQALDRRLHLDTTDLTQILGPRQVVVEFVSYWTGLTNGDGERVRGLAAFIVTKGDGVTAFMTTARPALSSEALLDSLKTLSPESDHWVDLEIYPEAMAKTLAQIAARYLAEELLIIPDGPLRTVGIGTLPLGNGYLDDAVLIRLFGNSSDLIRSSQAVTHSEAVFISCGGTGAIGAGEGNDTPAFQSLTGPDAETGVLSARCLGGASLSRPRTLQEMPMVARPSVLHIASHGYYWEPEFTPSAFSDWDDSVYASTILDVPRLHPIRGASLPLHSGLALNGANSWMNYSIQGQGVLTAYDMSWLDLVGTKCVVLSGCVTGVGPAERWRGLVDLRRAAMLGGAESVMVATRSVPDVATTILMLLMYQVGSAQPGPTNLRAAQRLLRTATVSVLNEWLANWGLKAPEFGGRYLKEVLAGPKNRQPFSDRECWANIVCYTSGVSSLVDGDTDS